MVAKLKSPFPWIGGKHYMIKHLLPLIPDHRVYCEVFGGGASLLIRKPPSKIEYYNDINSGLVNFFRVLRDEEKSKRLHDLLKMTPFSREEYIYCKKHWNSVDDDVVRAMMWFVSIRQSFAGRGGKAGWGYGVGRSGNNFKNQAHAWARSIDLLPLISERFRTVLIDNLDFRDMINMVDSEYAFFYLDPPYLLETRKFEKVYQYELSRKDHEDLLDIITKAKGKVMISGYNSDLYNTALSSWEKKEFDITCYAQGLSRGNNVTKREVRTEVVWMNYKLNGKLFEAGVDYEKSIDCL